MVSGIRPHDYKRLDIADNDNDNRIFTGSRNVFYEHSDFEDTPNESGVMIHVVETNRARWNHIDDLDSFCIRLYEYHQRHGFTVMILEKILGLGQFIFVVVFSIFLLHCVNYQVLFGNVSKRNETIPNQKTKIFDAILSCQECVSDFGAITWICIVWAIFIWLFRVVIVLKHIFKYWDIKLFYNTALKIDDKDLDNLTWHQVQNRIREVQREQQMCIHKQELTELDIYHRILRKKNYFVAMINKNLLPIKLKLPLIHNFEWVYMTRGLSINLDFILFSPFENNWHLKEDYKKSSKRVELADSLARLISYLALANLLACPFIFLWGILQSFFSYAEIIKREPGKLGSRCWSMYGKLYLRHFNELDHELNARLNRAYRPASKYMDSFTSPLMDVIARHVGFICGSIFAVLLVLTVYDEDVITVEHILTVMTLLGVIIGFCATFIPDENMFRCPETLLTAVLAHIHYFPDHWVGQAHTQRTRTEFSQLFQYKMVHLLEELFSPIITPYILFFKIRPKALDIVDFYRNFTVMIVGVGDVCSFSLMDVKKHGHPDWQVASGPPDTATNQYTQAEDGKTELSLIHFALTNPDWKMPKEAENFVEKLKTNAQKDLQNLEPENPLYQSIHTVSSLGTGYQSIMQAAVNNSLYLPQALRNNLQVQTPDITMPTSTNLNQSRVRPCSAHSARCVGLSHAEGPLFSDNNRSLLFSLQPISNNPSMGASMFGGVNSQNEYTNENNLISMRAADMSLGAMYLHELHQRQIRRRGNVNPDSLHRSLWQRPHQQQPPITISANAELSSTNLHRGFSINESREENSSTTTTESIPTQNLPGTVLSQQQQHAMMPEMTEKIPLLKKPK